MRQAITIEVHGRARRFSGDEREEATAAVAKLNGKRAELGRRIESEIRFAVPDAMDVRVCVDFKAGSIEWVILVHVLMWMGAFSGGAQLVEYISRAIGLAADRVIADELIHHGYRLGSRSAVEIVEGALPPATPPAEPAGWTGLKRITAFTIGNTVLLAVIIVLLAILLQLPSPESVAK